jgi:predicted Zn-dependent protease
MMRNPAKLLVPAAAIVFAGCAGVGHEMPLAEAHLVNSAAVEITSHPMPLQKRVMSAEEAEAMLHRVYNRLLPAAQEVCEQSDEQDTCWWDVDYADKRDFNAYATKENQIVVYHDVMTTVGSDDELAMVLAHEMGHHIADHIDETKTRAATGAILGAIAMAAVAANAGPCYSYSCTQNMSNAVESSAYLGAAIGNISFSVKQEKEADYLSAYILHNAGYSLMESRGVLVKMGAMSQRMKTGLFDTHPAGPDRLATYDAVIESVAWDEDGMPNAK